MRRKDREVTSLDEIFEIVDSCGVAHIGMVENGKPYVAALNFGYERRGGELILYFHSAAEGRKIDILKENPEICFEMDCINELIAGDEPCCYSWRYRSVVGNGRVEFIGSAEEKTHALNRILCHLEKTENTFRYPEEMLKNVCVFRVCTKDFSGKRHD